MAKKSAPKVGLRATSGNRVLAFGLVRVGVGMMPLMDSSTRIAGKMLDPEFEQPVKQRWENIQGDLVDRSDLLKGYEVAGQYVVLADGEVPKADNVDEINLVSNVPAAHVPSEYVERSYLLFPSEGQHEGYALAVAYLRDNDRAFIGLTTDAGTTKAFAVKYSTVTETLVAELLSYEANVRWSAVESVTTFMADVPEPSKEMLGMATTMFDTLPESFDWASVTDEYGEALADVIATKAAGQAVTVAAAKPKAAATPDLMAALRASVEGNKTAEAVEA